MDDANDLPVRFRNALDAARRGALVASFLALPLFVGAAPRPSAPTLTILHSFRLLPSGPQAGLVADASGNLYGTTGEGGDGNGGVVFRIQKDGSGFTVLHAFGMTPGDGAAPVATLTLDSSTGTLYGTTLIGGIEDQGTVFRIKTDGSEYALLHRFTRGTEDGAQPYGSVLLDSGILYGTTSFGGVSGRGIVFRMRTDGGDFTILHSFTGGPDGGNPKAAVVLDPSGNLYGTATQGGGTSRYGTVFKLRTNGSGFAVLHSFASGASDGFMPDTPLVRDSSGNLYGTTQSGSAGGGGTVYKVKPDGSGFQILHGFAYPSPDGTVPAGPVALDGSGNLYGTTFFGGTDDHGVLFKLRTDGSGFDVRRFAAPSDGAHPMGSILIDGSTLRATTFQGGAGGVGTLYAVDVDGSDFSVLHVFGVGILDGADPRAGLISDADGTLYGTSCDGQPGGHGTVFRVRPDGSGFTILHGFPFDASDGEDPSAPLLLDSAGNLYGTAYDGGSAGFGTAFKVGVDGSGFKVLRGFTGFPGDGAFPPGALVADGSGNLYGVTFNGGSDDTGMVFRVKSDGSGFTILHSFGGGVGDGAYPLGALIADSSENLYGTTEGGGGEGVGTVFRMKTNGTGFSVIHSFRDDPADGEFPEAALVLDSGNLYGTTSLGGAAGTGTVFRLKTDGTNFRLLHSFEDSPDDGADPRAPLALDSGGNLYGTTLSGGSHDGGIVFALKTDGSGYRILHDFRGGPLDGADPYGAVLLGAGGSLYGTTASGGAWFAGTVFKLSSVTGGVRVIPVTPAPAVPVRPRVD